jgi:hypothetical protein
VIKVQRPPSGGLLFFGQRLTGADAAIRGLILGGLRCSRYEKSILIERASSPVLSAFCRPGAAHSALFGSTPGIRKKRLHGTLNNHP